MPITATCQACQRQFQAPDSFAGKRVKCRHCGQVFQVPEATATPPAAMSGGATPGGNDPPALDALVGLETTGTVVSGGGRPRATAGSGGANWTGGNGPPAGRVVAETPVGAAAAAGRRNLDPDEETADADPDDPEENGGTGDDQVNGVKGPRRPNFPVLSYPGARLVDQGLPMGLLFLGLGWLALLASGDTEADGKPWIKLARFALPVILYRLVAFPCLYAGLTHAAEELNYHLPPNPKLRAFAAYLPAFVFGAALWILGDGSLPGLIVGLVMGLVLSSMLVFLLFRLREAEVATTIAYAAYGFGVGAALLALAVAGLNYVTALAVVQSKGQASVPVSPFGVGLPWSAKPPSTLANEGEMLTHSQAVRPLVRPATPLPSLVPPASATHGDAPTAVAVAPLVTDLHLLSLPGGTAGATVLQPLSDSPVVGLVRPAADGGGTVVAWNAVTDRQIGVEVGLPASQVGPPAIDDEGQYLAHIVTWPRRSIHFEAFASGRTVAKIDLQPGLKDPVLLGFVGPDRLLVRGHLGAGPVSALGAGLGNRGDDLPVILVVNTTDPRQTRQIELPPIAATGFPLAVSAAKRRLAVATDRDAGPAIVQFDLTTGEPLPAAINLDVDRGVGVAPTGFTYTADGKRLGVLIEHEGNAALLSYDATTGGNPTELDFPAPGGIAPKAARAGFKGNALGSLDAAAWAVYGNRLVNARSGEVIGPLPVDAAVDQRVVTGGRVALLSTSPGGGPRVQVATIDPTKYAPPTNAAIHP